MKDLYMQDEKSMVSSLTNKDMKDELLKEIESAILELNIAQENYNTATKGLVDYYSYRIKAAQSKYDYLIRIIKDMKINQMKIV